MTYNHCTADCGNGRFLVNRYGLSWREVTADNLCLVDVSGRLLEGEGGSLGFTHINGYRRTPQAYRCKAEARLRFKFI